MPAHRDFCSCCCWRRLEKHKGSEKKGAPQPRSFLNRGLGGVLRHKQLHNKEKTSVCSPALVILLIAAIITFSCGFCVESDYALTQDEIFKSDLAAQYTGLAHIAAIPLTCAAVNFLMVHIRQTTFWWDTHPLKFERSESADGEDDYAMSATLTGSRRIKSTYRAATGCCGVDHFAWWPMLIVTLGLLRAACTQAFNSSTSDHITFYIDLCVAFICLSLYYALLDQVTAIIKGMEEEQEEINRYGEAKPVEKMQNLVRNITRSRRKDKDGIDRGDDLKRAEKDVVYCFAQTNTVPAHVLSFVWWVYYVVGKLLGAAMIIAMFMGVSSALISRFLIMIVVLSAATGAGFVFELGPNALSLFRMSLNKPFYVGDLVTLNTNGAMDSQTSIMGFVENITMMYVVVRNFEMKQTWIPHNAFSNMIIQNWTRRPTKTVLLNIGISCRCPVKKVELLTEFAKRWIEASPEIQKNNYRKHHITSISNGYNLQIIFFPEIGVTHRGIRQKFLVALMKAAERMQIPFVPLQINQNYCDDSAGVPLDTCTASVDTSMLDDLLPNPNDRLPKGVGLGFREFPRNTSDVKMGLAALGEETLTCTEPDMEPDMERQDLDLMVFPEGALAETQGP